MYEGRHDGDTPDLTCQSVLDNSWLTNFIIVWQNPDSTVELSFNHKANYVWGVVLDCLPSRVKTVIHLDSIIIENNLFGGSEIFQI